MDKLLLSLGSNLGNRKENIDEALVRIQKKSRIISISGLFETSPVASSAAAAASSSSSGSHTDMEYFYNTCLLIENDIGLEESFHFFQKIEQAMGRTPSKDASGPKQPRIIDIDIIFFNRQSIFTTIGGDNHLIIPHPSYSNRRFVLIPILDIEKETRTQFLHPITRQSVQRYLELIDLSEKDGDEKQIVRRIGDIHLEHLSKHAANKESLSHSQLC